MRSQEILWSTMLSLCFMLWAPGVSAQHSNQGGSAAPSSGAQAPSSSGLSGISYDQAHWTELDLPKIPAQKRYVACYTLSNGNSSAQPFVLIPAHPKPLPAAGKTGFDVRCDSISASEQEPEMKKWCEANPKGSWTACSPIDENHPILMGQSLVVGVDFADVSRERLKILNLNVTSSASTPINPTPVRPSFGSSGFVSLAGGARYLTWPVQIPGDVLPTISVNLVYTPPTFGEAWSKNTYYPVGSIVTPTSRNGHYYMAVGSGVSNGSERVFPISLPVAVADGSIIWQDSGPATPVGGTGKPPGVWLASHTYNQGDAIANPYNGHVYIAMATGTSGPLLSNPFSLPTPTGGVIQVAPPPVAVYDGETLWNLMPPGTACSTAWVPQSAYTLPATVGPYNGRCYGLTKAGMSGQGPVQPYFPSGDVGVSKDSPTQPDSNKLAWIDLGVTPPAAVSGAQAADQTVNLLNLQLPQSHSRSYFNLAAGIVYSTVHSRTFGIPAGTTSTSGEVQTSSSPTIDPVLMFTAYPWPSDTERHCSFPKCMWQTKPGVSFGLSLATPSTSFYAGSSVEVLRNIQLVLGCNWAKATQLPNPAVGIPGNASSAITVQKFRSGGFFGLTFNVSGFIQGLFGGGGGGGSSSKSSTSGS